MIAQQQIWEDEEDGQNQDSDARGNRSWAWVIAQKCQMIDGKNQKIP
jgi:hypothetical protein